MAVGQNHRNLLNLGNDLRIMDQVVKNGPDQNQAVDLFLRQYFKIPVALPDGTARVAHRHIVALVAELLLDHIDHPGVMSYPHVDGENGDALHGLGNHTAGNGAGFVIVLFQRLLDPLANLGIDVSLIVQNPGHGGYGRIGFRCNVVDIHGSPPCFT